MTDDLLGKAEALLKQAAEMNRSGQAPSEVVELCNNAFEIAKQQQNDVLCSDSLFAKAHAQRKAGESANSMISFMEALHFAEQSDYKKGIGLCCTYLADGFMQVNDFEQGIQYNLRASEILKQTDSKAELFWTEFSIVNCYTGKLDFENALHHIDVCYSMIDTVPFENKAETKAIVDILLGNIYVRQNELEKAVSLFESSFKIFKETGNQHFYAGSLTQMGEVLVLQNKPQDVIRILSDENLKAINPLNGLSLLHSLSKAYEMTGDLAEALRHFKLYKEQYEALYNSDNSSKITAHQLNREIEKRKEETDKERKQKEELRKAYDLLDTEKHRSDDLLHNILPEEVAEELKTKGVAEAKLFEDVTVLFTDFKGFTTVSEKLSPQKLVNELHECFSAFDHIIHKYNIEKIKTVGDAYLAVSGLPTANPNHAKDIVKAALEIKDFMLTRKKQNPDSFEVRIGVHSGQVVAGIVGVKKFAYDIWGDTVNTAARMEQNGWAGKVNISEATYELVKDNFETEYRGEIEAKNKGKMKMYFIE